MSGTRTTEIVKEASMLKQKAMIEANYDRLAAATATGQKVVSTFVPGNLNELIMCFDMVNNLPEINAIQNGMRKKSGAYVQEAEKRGQSEDVCAYVKADLGMIARGNIGPDGRPLPPPDLLLLSYTGCFTFMKWFELLRQHYKCETAMLHVPYEGEGHATPTMVAYIVKQLREEVIPKLERASGVKFDIDRLRENLREVGAGGGELRLGAAIGEAPALADRCVFRRRGPCRPDLHRLPRLGRCHRVLPAAARRDRAAHRQRRRSDHARWRVASRALPASGGGAAELDEFP